VRLCSNKCALVCKECIHSIYTRKILICIGDSAACHLNRLSPHIMEPSYANCTPREVRLTMQVRHLEKQVCGLEAQVPDLKAQLEDQKAQVHDLKAQLEDQKAQVHGPKTQFEDQDADMEISDQLDPHKECDLDEYDSERTWTDSDATQPFSPDASDDDEFYI
jgi:hypothetical protein